jgi:hypothetical protein
MHAMIAIALAVAVVRSMTAEAGSTDTNVPGVHLVQSQLIYK